MESKSLQMRAEKLNSDGPSTPPPVFTFFPFRRKFHSLFACLAGVSLAMPSHATRTAFGADYIFMCLAGDVRIQPQIQFAREKIVARQPYHWHVF
jgi:hypothetical protein